MKKQRAWKRKNKQIKVHYCLQFLFFYVIIFQKVNLLRNSLQENPCLWKKMDNYWLETELYKQVRIADPTVKMGVTAEI